MRRITHGLTALAILIALVVVTPARAGMIPGAVTVLPESGSFRYSYSVILPSDYKLKSGDFFTIYDFHGFVGGSAAQPGNWSFSTLGSGPYPPHIMPVDDPSVPNLTWTYSGPDINTPGSLGIFSALSSNSPNGDTETMFASQDHRNLDGRAVGNITSVQGPPVSSRIPEVPEPSAWLLVALGLPLAGLAARLRRRGA